MKSVSIAKGLSKGSQWNVFLDLVDKPEGFFMLNESLQNLPISLHEMNVKEPG